VLTALAMDLRSIVLPALGGETIRPRWPRPMGATILMSLPDKASGRVSRSMSLSGKMGVKETKLGRERASSGLMSFIASTRRRE